MTKIFNDAIGFKWELSDQTLSDFKEILMSDSQGKKQLKTTIDATHSGVLTNGRVYPYLEVKDAYKSFFDVKDGGTAKYPAPVLTHHDEYKDAIGRIVGAELRTIKSGLELEKDYENPDPIGEKGSAAVQVTALISDEQSIEKIMDGRYYTVSAGFSVKDMYCSICGNSIFKCDHIPMRSYDEDGEPDSSGNLCYGITDGITYREVSFVNTPAQPSAQVTSFKWEDAKQKDSDLKTLVSLYETDHSLVKQAVLITDKLEFDLLSGKESRRNKVKYSIAPTAQRKLENFLSGSKTESTDDHSNDDRETTTKNETTIEPQPTQGENMTVNKDDKTLDKTVASLTDKNSELSAELNTANERIQELEAAGAEKDTRIESLESEANELRTEVADMLATAVASLRIRLKKPDTVALDSDEKKTEYTAKLAKRSLESLRDSINDLTIEADQVQDEPNDLTDAVVTSPVLSNGSKPTDSNADSATSKDPLDRLLG